MSKGYDEGFEDGIRCSSAIKSAQEAYESTARAFAKEMGRTKEPEPNADDFAQADALSGLEYLDAASLRKVYRILAACYYAAIRELNQGEDK